MAKTGISIDIPGFGTRHILAVLTDYTGTLSRGGRLEVGVRELLCQLAEAVDIHVLTADTFGMAETELKGVPVTVHRLTGDRQDVQKQEYGINVGLRHCAVLGNGNNDRLLLKAAKDEGGIAIAVDNGEGCATDALLSSNLFIVGAPNALALFRETRGIKATLRF
jgi:soluble P-type ATPase